MKKCQQWTPTTAKKKKCKQTHCFQLSFILSCLFIYLFISGRNYPPQLPLNCAKKLVQDIHNSFNNPAYSDVDIVIDHKMLKAHKHILARNQKFHKMFTKTPDLKEILISEISDSVEYDIRYLFCKGDLDQEQPNDILNFSSTACETYLRYLYAADIGENKISLDLILVSHKFCDEELKNVCENHLVNNVNMRNAIRTLLVSLETGCDKLKKKSCKLMTRNFCEMKFIQNFNLILENKEAMAAILSVLGNFSNSLNYNWKQVL